MEFAKKLFTVTPMGGTVVIAGGNQDPVKRPAAGVLAPAMAGVTAAPAAPLSARGHVHLEPGRGADRPGVDHHLDRRPAGRGAAQRGRDRARTCLGPGGNHAGPGDDPDRRRPPAVDPGRGRGPHREPAEIISTERVEQMHLPAPFVAGMRSVMKPGTTVLVTQASVSGTTTGAKTTVMDAGNPGD